MIFETAEFTFKASPAVARARRILIKPSASHPVSSSVTTSQKILSAIIDGIRQVSNADIILLDGTPTGGPIHPIYQALGYNFPRVLTLDIKDCTLVEVDNPLPKPFAMSTFWIPNIILSSDYLITVSPLKIFKERNSLSIMNLLTLLPTSKYHGEATSGWEVLYSLGLDKIIADLYFTIPFDLGIVEARQKPTNRDDPTLHDAERFASSGVIGANGDTEEYGKIFMGEPYEVDREASGTLGLETKYLDLIKAAKIERET